mgnify:CR=1 FL=1|jgi:hypothetical protein
MGRVALNTFAAEVAPSRRDLAGPALRAFFNIAGEWGLSVDQERRLLGSPGRSTYFRWKKYRRGAVPHDVIERISYILGIYKALHILFPDKAQADGWVKRPNDGPLFGGRSALEQMLGGQVADLYVVRQYLDAQRGWG